MMRAVTADAYPGVGVKRQVCHSAWPGMVAVAWEPALACDRVVMRPGCI
jgi:hypothetical protein